MLQFNFFSALWPKDALLDLANDFFQDVIRIFFFKKFLLLQNSNAKDEHHHEPKLKPKNSEIEMNTKRREVS